MIHFFMVKKVHEVRSYAKGLRASLNYIRYINTLIII